MIIFNMCDSSLAVVTPVKYECDTKDLCCIFAKQNLFAKEKSQLSFTHDLLEWLHLTNNT